ncbi:MAG: transporter substrate-binding domain-containing protein [Clostridia bacterium]|nr:transporter substrate-binding domain-containing protein [Clostridia bacterium]MBQ2421229.1 transporter substrate-binding domain-containing protein [Clostridia bacterium]MBQ5902044.1 transporter substrate-binding domain-containing protein [Clostridia bacterium]
MKKILALVLALVLCLGCFAACGGNDADTNDGTEKEVLTMCTNATFPPYEYYDGDKIIGIDAEIAQAIADKLGMELVIEDMEFNSIISYVNANDNAFGMAGMTVTEDRKKTVDFTTSYAKGIQSVIVKADSDIKSIDDLAGKKIGVQLSTTGDIYATDDFGADFVTQYNKATDCVLGLTKGDVDAVIIDNAPAKVFVEQNEGLVLLDAAYADEDYAIAVKKGDAELLEKLDTAITELIADGTVAKIVEKYIPSEN